MTQISQEDAVKLAQAVVSASAVPGIFPGSKACVFCGRENIPSRWQAGITHAENCPVVTAHRVLGLPEPTIKWTPGKQASMTQAAMGEGEGI